MSTPATLLVLQRSLLTVALLVAACGEPPVGAPHPDAGLGAADAGSHQPDAGAEDADAGIDDADAGTDGADAGTDGADAGTGGADSGTGGADSGTGGADAGTGGADAGTDGADAGTGGADAGTVGADAGTGGADAGTDGADAGNDDADAGTDDADAGTDEPDAGGTDLTCGDDADCNDLNPCTSDLCVVEEGEARGRCEHEPVEALCNDGDVCTVDDRCVDGVCAGAVATCDGPCQTGVCDPEAGGCVVATDGTVCDDGDEYTHNDICTAGLCRGVFECAAGEPRTECTFEKRQFNPTTGEMNCQLGYYSGRPCTPDADPCTRDVCNGTAECAHLPMPEGTECDHPCGVGQCNADGSCELVASTCDALSDFCGEGVCREDECVYEPHDPSCLASGVQCVPLHGFCIGSTCGDGWCDESEEGTLCVDCQGECDLGCRFSCNLPYRDFPWRGAWRAHQSVAYNFARAFAHQTETFTRMLDDGLRWLHLIADYCQPGADSGPICLCAGDDTCALDSTPLEARLREIKTWMEAHPLAVVTLYFEREFVRDDDLKAAFESTGLSGMLYRDRPTYNEPWDLSVRNMATMNRRLVVVGGPYIQTSEVFLTTDGPVHDGDGPAPNNFVFNLEGRTREWECDRDGRGPMRALGPMPLYVVRHVLPANVDGGLTDWSAAGCYNRLLDDHMGSCRNRHTQVGRVTVGLTQFYNTSSLSTELRGFDQGYDFHDTSCSVTTYPDHCPEDVTPCDSDDDCDSGVCGLFGTCLACETDDDCPASQHCNTLWNGCLADLPDGSVCLRDAECRSGDCDVLCHSCTDHADCQEDEWCDAFGGCQPKNANGYACLSDVECVTGNCWLGFCVDCNAQDDCPGNQFCSLSPAPGESTCLDPKDNGALCAADFECASGACHLGTCQPCNGHDDCGVHEYCTLPALPGVASECRAKKPFAGECLSSVECQSSFCLGSRGMCSTPCSSDGQCGADQYCDLTFSGCAPKVGVGSVCVEDRVCTTGNCYLGTCVECNEHGDCGSSLFCSLDPVPGQSQCLPKKGFGSVCANPVECTSGRCDATCVDCTAVPQAGCNFGTRYCEFGRCHGKKNVGETCSFSDQCKWGICDVGQCAQCTNVPQTGCDFDAQYCEARRCHDKKNVGAECGFSDQCKSGICDVGQCAECTNVPQTGCDFDTQYCEARRCHDKKEVGATCDFSDQCESGVCEFGKCVQCTNVPRLGCNFDTQYCEGTVCHNKRNNGDSCGFSDQCKSGICDVGTCVQCTNVPKKGCNFNAQYCEWGACHGKKNAGEACGFSDQCKSNDCFLWICQ